jgi:AcrR family transcriptional regulator
MTRIVKKPEERKTEILDAAEKLFHTKGYEATTISDIIAKAGIARGTVYYYFKSKDEIMDAVIERSIVNQIESLMPIVNKQNLDAVAKIKQIITENSKMNLANQDMLDYLHQPQNVTMHQKSLVQGVRKSAPVIAQIIQQGVDEGQFKTEYPLELAEIILVGISFLFDPSIFPRSRAEYLTRMRALADVFETTLRADQGSFDFLPLLAEEIFPGQD